MSSPSQLDSRREYKKAKRLHLKTTRDRNPELELDWTPFRAAEKRYKSRFPPPDLSNVLDLATLVPTREREILQGFWRGRSDVIEHTELVGTNHHKCYVISHIPGLVILPGFISPEKQRELIRWALSDHARHPNETNLDAHYLVPEEGIWNACLNSQYDPTKNTFVQPRATKKESSENQGSLGPRRLIHNTPATPVNFIDIASIPKPIQVPSATARPALPSALLPKLRWANIGWYYHWGTKQYDFAKGRGTIHPSLREVCKNAVATVDWRLVYGQSEAKWEETEPSWMTWDETYEPDAGIVNFYQTKDTLMAHVDRSEVCTTSPLVSISLGNAAIFLIGGLTRDSEPVPILLRSGDVVILSGPYCRRAYHGVPRILEGTLPAHLGFEYVSDGWKPYSEYLQRTRINVNVRQVFPRGFEP